jgi:mxaL protein
VTGVARTFFKPIVARLTAPGQRLLLMLVACLLLLLSLANPSLNLPRNIHDFLFVLDITGSMNVADAGPREARQRRLSFAKELVRKALEEIPCGSRAGLAVLKEHRTFLLFAPVEICENHLVLSTMLDEIDGRMAWAELSEVAKGLYSGIAAVGTLAEMDGEGAAAFHTHLVFLTDGHEAPPVHPTLRPKFRGEPGATGGLIAGIGGSELQPIPYLDEENEVAGYWAQDEVLQIDRHSLGRPSTQGSESMAGVDGSDVQERIARGTEHLSSLRESYLQQLAADTGLDYLRTTTDEAFARALLDSRYATRQRVLTNVAWVPAALSLLCLMYVFGSPLLRRAATGVRQRGRPLAAPRRSDTDQQRLAPHR